MSDIPHVLIIKKSSYPHGIKVEECERMGKTDDNKDAIIRYQRRADVGVLKQIGRFFSDLFNGITRAKGIVCDKPELPSILQIRGKRFNITREANSIKALVAPPDGEHQQAAPPALTMEVREVPAQEGRLRKISPALAQKVAEELRDRFEAAGQASDRVAVEYFLALDAKPKAEMTEMRIVQLLHFSDALGRMSGTLRKELGEDVLAHVLSRMKQWEDRIAKMEVQGPDGPKPAYPEFRFKCLSKYATESADTTPGRAAPALAATPLMPPSVSEALHQPHTPPQPGAQLPQTQAQPQPQLQPQAQEQVQPQVQPEPPSAPKAQQQLDAPEPAPKPTLAPSPPPPPPPAPTVLTTPPDQPKTPTERLDASSLASARLKLRRNPGEAGNSLPKPSSATLSKSPTVLELQKKRTELRHTQKPEEKVPVSKAPDDPIHGALMAGLSNMRRAMDPREEDGKNDPSNKEWDDNSS